MGEVLRLVSSAVVTVVTDASSSPVEEDSKSESLKVFLHIIY